MFLRNTEALYSREQIDAFHVVKNVCTAVAVLHGG